MGDPGPPANAADITDAVDEALQGLELEPHETSEILNFANREVPHLQTPETSHFILGSYRDPFIRRLRIVENELNKRLGTYPFLMGDVRELEIERLPTFRIRFTLLATYADSIVAVFEQDAGGEITELGKISEAPYFEKASVLPRDYAWMAGRQLETRADVLAAAINVYYSADLDSSEIDDELELLVTRARANGVDVSREELVDRIDERQDAETEAATYSWVHLNEFRLFELHDRCFPWAEPEELRERARELP